MSAVPFPKFSGALLVSAVPFPKFSGALLVSAVPFPKFSSFPSFPDFSVPVVAQAFWYLSPARRLLRLEPSCFFLGVPVTAERQNEEKTLVCQCGSLLSSLCAGPRIPRPRAS